MTNTKVYNFISIDKKLEHKVNYFVQLHTIKVPFVKEF